MVTAIFLTGLGDDKPRPVARIFLAVWWRLFGVKLVDIPIGWAKPTGFDRKLERILKRIDELSVSEGGISLIGTSAGASAALNAYVLRPEKINRVVFIAGKYIGAKNVNREFYRKNPDFKESMELAEINIRKLSAADKRKFLSVRPLNDYLVPPDLNDVAGIKVKKIWAAGHVKGIVAALTVFALPGVRFIKGN